MAQEITPISTRHYPPSLEALADLPDSDECPIAAEGEASSRGFLVRLP